MITQSILFKEWLPDQPALGNAGLVEATNVVPTSTGYDPFLPLDASGSTIASVTAGVNGAFAAVSQTANSEGVERNIFWNNGKYYWSVAVATLGDLSANSAIFAQYEDEIFVANHSSHIALLTTIAATRQFAEITAAPYADTIAVVGQFVVAGNLWDDTDGTRAFGGSGTARPFRENYVQWGAIDDPTNWPQPGSSTAIASQAGEQGLDRGFGAVMAIHGGEQFGVILQNNAVTRMTYVGGSVVFQFDTIAKWIGSKYIHGSVMVGGLTYFLSQRGFCMTDGSVIRKIGDGRVDRQWDTDYASATDAVSCAYDPVNECVCWGMGNKIYYYHPATDRWSVANQDHMFLMTPNFTPSHPSKLIGWDDNGVRGEFAATAGSAVFTTGEAEFNPGGYSRLSGFKPLVSGSTAVSMTVAIGTRNSQDTAASFTSETTPTTRTGFADFRAEARYHRARVTITGDFDQAIGGEFTAVESGDT